MLKSNSQTVDSKDATDAFLMQYFRLREMNY